MRRKMGNWGNVGVVLAVVASVACTSDDLFRGGEPEQPRALAPVSVSEAELREHLFWLADDARMGRDTRTDGAKAASEYIADHFRSAGLVPLPGQEEFRIPYLLNESGYDANHTQIAIESSNEPGFTLGNDFRPFGFSTNGAIEADVAFAGYGITAPDLGYDDYKDLDVEGKVVFVLRHAPPDSDGQVFAQTGYSFYHRKAANAQKHGAVGMLLVSDPRGTEAPDDFSVGSSLFVPPADDGVVEEEEEEEFLAAHVSTEVATRFLLERKQTLAELQTELDGGAAASALSLGTLRIHFEVTEAEPKIVFGHNVAGFLPGNDPEHADEWVVVGAHYDHLGTRDDSDGDRVYNGADDNASGTSAVLALAKALAEQNTNARSIVFLAFSGEERGLLGSRSLLIPRAQVGEESSHVWLDPTRVRFMLNLDMIGRNPDMPVRFYGDGFSTQLRDSVERHNGKSDLEIRYMGTEYLGASDHHPFFTRGIPTAFFFTGVHRDYHGLGDHADLIAFQRMAKIATLGGELLADVATRRINPQRMDPKSRLQVTGVHELQATIAACHGHTHNLE